MKGLPDDLDGLVDRLVPVDVVQPEVPEQLIGSNSLTRPAAGEALW